MSTPSEWQTAVVHTQEPNSVISLVDRIARRDRSRSEATLQADIRALLLSPSLGLIDSQLSDSAPLESPVSDGTRRRIDIEIGGTVIEVKKDLDHYGIEKAAVEQLAGYVQHKVDVTGNRFVGVLTDGSLWKAYALDQRQNSLSLVSESRVESGKDTDELLIWLEAVMATRENITPSPNEIVNRLGVDSPAHKLDHATLRTLLNDGLSNPEIVLKKQLWSRLLKTALGDKFEDSNDLFVDHTLLVLQANVIGHAVVGLDLTQARTNPQSLVDGLQFLGAQIHNVVEDDLFGWVLDVDGGDRFVRNLIRQVARFDWNDVKHDVLKVLYESVISPSSRKSLGEYFTPDWLAERVILARIDSPLEQRVLDPACGSGTFIFHSIRHFLTAADAAGLTNSETLNLVQRRVFGMDIHPVSVVLARVTYLLAIGRDRLTSDRADLTVPIYLGDSMQWDYGADSILSDTLNVPIDATDMASGADNTQGTLFPTGRELAFPLSILHDPVTFDRFVDDLAKKAQTHTNNNKKLPSPDGILDRYGIVESKDREILKATFQLLCELNAEGRNHIWGYFVRNQVRPRWLSRPEARVDVLVGNPPWVAYRYMTSSMQKQFRAFSERRNLWSGGSVATTQDLVGLFVARTVEQFLKPRGFFGFVVPRAVLSRKPYDGFRSGRWNTEDPTIDDSAANTRVTFQNSWDLLGIKCAPDLFPVPAAAIFGERSGRASGLDEGVIKLVGKLPARNIDLSEAAPHITESTGRVRALSLDSDSASPYARGAFQGAILSPRVLVFVQESGASTLGGSSLRVNVISDSSTHKPWSLLEPIKGSVERTFVRAVHLRATIVPFGTQEPARAVLPISNNKLLDSRQIDAQPGLSDWWATATRLWETNRTASNAEVSFAQNIDWLGKLSGQLGKGANRVVYTASGTTMMASRLADPSVVVDNSLYWLSVPSRDAALYLVAVLNSTPLLELVSELQAVGNFGPRHFHKLPFNAPIALFDRANPRHLKLVSLAAEAEVVANATIQKSAARFGPVKTSRLVWSALRDAGLMDAIDSLIADLF